MTQIDVTLTDYGLALECAGLGTLLGARGLGAQSLGVQHRRGLGLAAWYLVFFFSISAAALAGGTVHGFFLDETSSGYRVLWPLTLIAIGVTALAGIRIAAGIEFRAITANRIAQAAAVFFVLYCGVILGIRQDFLVAILGYLPTMLFLGTVFLRAYLRFKKPALLSGFLGICTMLLAAVAQQAKIGIHPQYFNHNAVYHVLQAAGLFMVYRAAYESCKLQENLP